MKRRVYIETSVVSYLASRPSRDVIVAGRQQLTHTWWEVRRPVFDLVISQVVLDEVRAGDPEAAQRRLAFLADVPSLDVTTEAAELAAMLIERVPLPTQAAADAAHIANATLRRRVESVCRDQGYSAPVLCTPDELMEGVDE